MWKTLSSQLLVSVGGIELLLRCNYDDYVIKRDFVGKIPAFYVELLKAWYTLKDRGNIITNDKQTSQVLWYNKEIIIITRTHYYLSIGLTQEWIYLDDIYKNNRFISIANLEREGKKLIFKRFFYYSRLRHAIPNFLLSSSSSSTEEKVVKEYIEPLTVPTLYSNGRELKIENLTSKQFYQLLEENKVEIELPVYWPKRIDKEVNSWKSVVIRIIVKVKENKLKEFNFKIIYNLIPTKRNLFLWKLRNDDICEVCKSVEDLQHTFVYCQLHHYFYSKLKHIILKKFDLDLPINDDILLKLYSEYD